MANREDQPRGLKDSLREVWPSEGKLEAELMASRLRAELTGEKRRKTWIWMELLVAIIGVLVTSLASGFSASVPSTQWLLVAAAFVAILVLFTIVLTWARRGPSKPIGLKSQLYQAFADALDDSVFNPTKEKKTL